MVERLLSLLPQAVRAWDATDPAMARAARERPPQRRPGRPRGPYPALVTALIHQQISVAAGRSILRRVRAACGGQITPAAMESAGPTRLRSAGVSPQKLGYLLDLTQKVQRGALDFRRLPRLPDAAVVEALTAVRGVGEWTAKMFLIFHLARPDVVAPEDLGLQKGASLIYGVRPGQARRFLETKASRWAPYRSLACLTLWEALNAPLEKGHPAAETSARPTRMPPTRAARPPA